VFRKSDLSFGQNDKRFADERELTRSGLRTCAKLVHNAKIHARQGMAIAPFTAINIARHRRFSRSQFPDRIPCIDIRFF